MPVIVFASPKGGSGKSTAALLLGTELAAKGANVTMLDCDPNNSLKIWGDKCEKLPNNMTLVHTVEGPGGDKTRINEDNIIDTIEKYGEREGEFVIVDLEGVASLTVTRAIAFAHLVLTPMKPVTLDVVIGDKMKKLITAEEKTLRRKIPHAIVLTKLPSHAFTAENKGYIEALKAKGFRIVYPGLVERSAYSALFTDGGNLRTMERRGNQDAAIDEAGKFCDAIVEVLKEGQGA